MQALTTSQKRPLLHVTQTPRPKDLDQQLISKRGSLMPNAAQSWLVEAPTPLQKRLLSKYTKTQPPKKPG
jgi:hypothetical protein